MNVRGVRHGFPQPSVRVAGYSKEATLRNNSLMYVLQHVNVHPLVFWALLLERGSYECISVCPPGNEQPS